MRNDIVTVMQDLYFDSGRSRAVLLEIGIRPAQIPEFRAAETFWPDVVLRLENGIVVDGIPLLLAVVARENPGNEAAQALLAQLRSDLRRVKVLCFFVDPLRNSKIRIDREARLLQEIARAGGFELAIRPAARVNDIITSILDEKPTIVHFGGHGTKNDQLIFEDDRGAPAVVGTAELVQVIGATAEATLDCVVLNSCYAAGNASSFLEVSRGVAGSVSAIDDSCALAFARGFYTGTAAGQSAAKAYKTGRAQMGLEGCDASGLHFDGD